MNPDTGEISASNGYPARISGLEYRYTELKQDFTDIRQQMAAGFAQMAADSRQGRERTDAQIQTLSQSLIEKGKASWGVIGACGIGAFGIITTLVGSGWYLTTLQTQNLTTPLALRSEVLGTAVGSIEQRLASIEADNRDTGKLMQANDARDAASVQDRADTRQRLDRMQETLGKLSGDVITNSSALTEIETQFKADEMIATQRESNTEQWKGMFYNWTTGATLPPRGPVIPGIARDPAR